MKRYIFLLLTAVAPLSAQFTKYSGEFMAVGVGARPLAMGSAFTAVAGDGVSVYWNPAGLQQLDRCHVHAMHSERFSGMVNWDFINAALPLKNGHALSVSYFRLGVEGIPLTRLQNPDLPVGEIYTDSEGRRTVNDPYVLRRIDNVDNAVFFSYAAPVAPDLALGGNAKLFRKTAGPNSAWGMGFDVGLLYTKWKRLQAGVIIRDITGTYIAWRGKTREWIAPSLTAGVSSLFTAGNFRILAAADLAFNFENRDAYNQLKAGAAGLQIRSGCELTYKQMLFFRAGFNHTSFTAGTGFTFSSVTVDYGFSPHSELGNTHRISLTFQLPANQL